MEEKINKEKQPRCAGCANWTPLHRLSPSGRCSLAVVAYGADSSHVFKLEEQSCNLHAPKQAGTP